MEVCMAYRPWGISKRNKTRIDEEDIWIVACDKYESMMDDIADKKMEQQRDERMKQDRDH